MTTKTLHPLTLKNLSVEKIATALIAVGLPAEKSETMRLAVSQLGRPGFTTQYAALQRGGVPDGHAINATHGGKAIEVTRPGLTLCARFERRELTLTVSSYETPEEAAKVLTSLNLPESALVHSMWHGNKETGRHRRDVLREFSAC